MDWRHFWGDMMVLALISTACISNFIYSLQAMLIYARISNAMETEDLTLLDCFFTSSSPMKAHTMLSGWTVWSQRWFWGTNYYGCFESFSSWQFYCSGSQVLILQYKQEQAIFMTPGHTVLQNLHLLQSEQEFVCVHGIVTHIYSHTALEYIFCIV